MAQLRSTNSGLNLWVTLGVAVASAATTWFLLRPAPMVPLALRALSIALPEAHDVVETALSPDGTRLVYSTIADGRVQLFLRSLDSFTVEPLLGTDDATQPFFSPDGSRVGFFASGFLRSVALDGSSPVDVIPVSGETAGASWGPDQIVFAPARWAGPAGCVSRPERRYRRRDRH